jgi:hypothetical protein
MFAFYLISILFTLGIFIAVTGSNGQGLKGDFKEDE